MMCEKKRCPDEHGVIDLEVVNRKLDELDRALNGIKAAQLAAFSQVKDLRTIIEP